MGTGTAGPAGRTGAGDTAASGTAGRRRRGSPTGATRTRRRRRNGWCGWESNPGRRPGSRLAHPDQRPTGNVQAGLRLPPRDDRSRSPLRPRQRHPRSSDPPGGRSRGGHLHGLLRPLQRLGTLRPPPPTSPLPPGRRHSLRLPPPDLGRAHQHARLRQRLHPPPRRHRLRLARRRLLRRPPGGDPAPGADRRSGPPQGRGTGLPAARPVRDRRRDGSDPAQPDAPLRRGHDRADDGPGPPGRDGSGGSGTGPSGKGVARLGGEDPARRRPRGGRPGRLGGRGPHEPDPDQTAGGTGRPLGPQGSRGIPRTPGGPAARVHPAEGTDVLVELAARTRDFSTRTGLPTTYRPTGEHGVPPVPPAVARQLLTIATEAMENAHRHATPPRSTSRRGSTTVSSASASTTTAAASPRARPSNSCAGRATSAWSAWSSGRHRWVRVSVSAGAATTRARRSAWNFRWAP